MFRKLVTNLPYSPGLLSQVSFYARRLQKEELTRRTGLILTALSLIVQAMYFAAPPVAALGSSYNDIVYGGGDINTFINAYDNGDSKGRKDVDEIFNRFGIERHNLTSGAVRERIYSYASNNYYSIGRHAHFGPSVETEVDVPGGDNVFLRPLHAWDTYDYSTYWAWRITTDDGHTYWILESCGNIVQQGHEVDPLPPDPEVTKGAISPSSPTLEPGEEITYQLQYRNNGPGNAGLFAMTDVFPEHTTFVSVESGANYYCDDQKPCTSSSKQITFNHIDETTNPYGILGPSTFWHTVYITVRVNDDAPESTEICNIARIAAITGEEDTSEKVCKTVERKVEPVYECRSLTWQLLGDSKTRGKFTVKGYAKDTKILNYVINPGVEDGGDPIIIKTDQTEATAEYEYPDEAAVYEAAARVRTEAGQSERGGCEVTVEVEPPEVEAIYLCRILSWEFKPGSRTEGTFTMEARVENTEIKNFVLNTGGDDPDGPIIVPKEDIENGVATVMYEYPDEATTWEARARVNTEAGQSEVGGCTVEITIPEEPPEEVEPIISYTKRAANITQEIEDANNTTAQPGDIIEYSLVTMNTGDGDAIGFELPAESIADILEYADGPFELGDGIYNEEEQIITWPTVNIRAGETVIKTFRVQVKDPIPETPVSTSDASSFDLTMTNVYGATSVNIELPTTPGKTVEKYARPLPKTGPGANALVSAILLGSVTYFYFRNRLIAKELKMIQDEYKGTA